MWRRTYYSIRDNLNLQREREKREAARERREEIRNRQRDEREVLREIKEERDTLIAEFNAKLIGEDEWRERRDELDERAKEARRRARSPEWDMAQSDEEEV